MLAVVFRGNARPAGIALVLALIATSAGGQETGGSRSLAPDVEYRRISVDSRAGEVTVHMVLVDLDAVNEGRLCVEPAQGGDHMGVSASPEAIARRVGAVAAINGPYFGAAGGRTYPLGFAVLDGRIAQLGNLRRPMVGIDPGGHFMIEVAHPQAFVTSDVYFEPIWLWGVNTAAGEDVVTLYDQRWGGSVSPQGGVVVSVGPIHDRDEGEVIVVGPGEPEDGAWDGEVAHVSKSGSLEVPEGGYALVFRGRSIPDAERYPVGSRFALYAYELPDGWEAMRWIATLGPWFVHEGRVRDFSDETGYGDSVTSRAGRSAIGITWNDEIFFAVTRGPGLTVEEAARVLIECNVREAVMCDSGSSSGMWATGVGRIGNARAVPLAFVVRELGEPPGMPAPLRVWRDILHRH